MTQCRFEGRWPILPGTDLSKAGRGRLITQASAEIDALAEREGGRIVGRVDWRVDVDQMLLVAEAPAVKVERVAA